MVAKFSSISTRKLSRALSVLTRDKTMVATSDYGDFHKMVKRYVMTSMLGTSGQVLTTITFEIIQFQHHLLSANHSFNQQGSKNAVTPQISETISRHKKHDD
jgi:hypothetical protein